MAMYPCLSLPSLSFPSVSGAVCSFDSQYAGLPLKSHTVDIDSVSGVSAIHIGNISDNTNISYFKGVLNGTYGFVDLGTLNWSYEIVFGATLTGSKADGQSLCLAYERITGTWTLPDKRYRVGTNGVRIRDDNYTDADIFKSSLDGTYLIYELSTPTTPSFTNAEFEALCESFGMNGQSATIQIGQTVNEGEYDARTGILEVTLPSVQTIPLPPCPIETLEGENNIWADTGDTTLQYPKFG